MSMNSKTVTFIVIFLLTINFFTGCTETTNNEEIDNTTKNSKTFSFYELMYYIVETYDIQIPWDTSDDILIGEGFIKNDSADFYKIYGRINNKSDTNTTVDVTIDFYDINDTFLDSFRFTTSIIPKHEGRTFSIRIDSEDIDSFNEVDHIVFYLQ